MLVEVKLKNIIQGDYSDRESYLNDLMNEIPKKILDRLNNEIHQIEKNIQTKFPTCLHISLEINNQ